MSDVRAGMIIAGKYRIEEPLARGGMGSVWRARHLALETRVAVKFISPEVFAQPEARRRFQREARAAALLQSPHVVQIYDYGVEGDVPYLVMELLRGEDLGERLKRKERLSLEETVSIVIQAARALRRAADAGIVHRDLKPSNVFILRGDEDEELVKVLDFGIAKTPTMLVEDDFTKTGAIIGSPRYMSPEQARGSRLVDPRSDLWSLAVIAYRALTGQLPFQSMDMLELIEKICTETPTPPSRLDPSLDPEIDAFFAKALSRDPAGRYQTAREMASMFAICCGQPPPSVTSSRLKLSSLLGPLRPGANVEPRASGDTPRPPGRATAQAAERAVAMAATRLSPVPPLARLAASAATEAVLAPASTRGATSPPSGKSSLSPAPACEPTRISGGPPLASGRDPRDSPTAAEPRRITPVPKGTPTPCPSDVDVPCEESVPPPRRVLSRRVAFGAGLAVLVLGALALQTWWRGTTMPAVADSAAAPLGEGPQAVTPVEPSSRASAAERAAPSAASSTTTAPESTAPQLPRTAPALPGRLRPKKKNPILGI